MPTGNTKLLEYTYSVSQIGTSGGNYARPTGVTYPSGTAVTYSQPDQPTPTYGSMDYGYERGDAGVSPLTMDYRTFEPRFWRTIAYEGRSADGGEIFAVLLRPLAWLEQNAIEVGSAFPLELGGKHGDGIRVVSVGPAPGYIEPGSSTRGMVISTFRRTDREVLEIFLDTDPTPLTVTPEHPVWSADREAWVDADELGYGERIATLDGVAYVLAKLPAGERAVYNLEVLGDHTYFAGDQGVWVHNCGGAGRAGRQARLRAAASDPNVSSAHRGWLRQEANQVARGTRSGLRNPPGTELAHRRGFEARKGFSYKYSDLQERALHRSQHRIERMLRKIGRRL